MCYIDTIYYIYIYYVSTVNCLLTSAQECRVRTHKLYCQLQISDILCLLLAATGNTTLLLSYEV